MEALERRRNEIDKYLVQKSNQSRLAHWTSNAGSTVSDSGFDEASTGAPTPRESSRQSLADPSGYQSDASVTEGRSPRSGRLRGGFAYSDRPILGQSPERSRSFSDQRHKLQLSNLGASPPSQVGNVTSTSSRLVVFYQFASLTQEYAYRVQVRSDIPANVRITFNPCNL